MKKQLANDSVRTEEPEQNSFTQIPLSSYEAQKRYEDKIKEKKKAEIEAKKAAIRAEDIAKGVFVPVSQLPTREPQKGVQTP